VPRVSAAEISEAQEDDAAVYEAAQHSDYDYDDYEPAPAHPFQSESPTATGTLFIEDHGGAVGILLAERELIALCAQRLPVLFNLEDMRDLSQEFAEPVVEMTSLFDLTEMARATFTILK